MSPRPPPSLCARTADSLSGAVPDLTKLDHGFDTLDDGTLWKPYALANPNEARALAAYVRSLVAGGHPVPPGLRTKTGSGLVEIIEGGYGHPVPPAGPGVLLPSYTWKLTPGWFNHQDDYTDPKTHQVVNPHYNSAWLYPHSPTRPYRSPDSFKTVAQSYLLLDPRQIDADGRPGVDEWWFVVGRIWPAGYPFANHGDWGTIVNLHNVAGDAGPGGGIGWSFGSGVSCFSVLQTKSGPAFHSETFESGGHTWQCATPAAGAPSTYIFRIVFGRDDNSTVRPGEIDAWADGLQVVHERNCNTVQRAQGPDGQWYTQHWLQLWEGDYTRNLPVVAQFGGPLSGVGRTLAEALADLPVAAGTNLSSSFFGGSGPNFGPPTAIQVGTFDTAWRIIPAELLALAA